MTTGLNDETRENQIKKIEWAIDYIMDGEPCTCNNPTIVCKYCEAVTVMRRIAEQRIKELENIIDTLPKPSEYCNCGDLGSEKPGWCDRCKKPVSKEFEYMRESKPSVGLTITRDFCKDKLIEQGGLIFSPPDKDDKVIKIHMCKNCYYNYKLKPSVPSVCPHCKKELMNE